MKPDPYRKRACRLAFIGGRGVGNSYSGIETFYEEVGSRLVNRGHDVTAYCRSHFTAPASNYRGIHVVRLPSIRSKHLDSFVHSFLATAHATAQNFDLIHYHAIGPSVFALPARLASHKTVVTVHAQDWARPKWKAFARSCLRAAEWASVTFPHRTIAVSHTLGNYLRTKHGAAVSVIPNGVTIRPPPRPGMLRRLGLTPHTYVLFAGRLSEEKRVHLLIEAFCRTAAPDSQLVIAGGASHQPAYELQLHRKADRRVRFLGWVDPDTLGELYSNCALFVLPSILEGFSVALLEAMSYAAPVLVSDIPANLEVIGNTGFSFSHDDLADLTDQLSRLLAQPRARQRAGIRARQRIADYFTWDVVTTQIEAVYAALCAPGLKGRHSDPRAA